jgi:hypothetical protein
MAISLVRQRSSPGGSVQEWSVLGQGTVVDGTLIPSAFVGGCGDSSDAGGPWTPGAESDNMESRVCKEPMKLPFKT